MNQLTKKFKTGDKVIAATGGVTMTIDYFTKNGKYNCKWHDGTELKEGEFNPELLQLKSNRT